ncbi:hypothetical protein BRD06_09215 [Halobacteriales archaeon QS_9_67_15]|nr:MAG: hypothetical protein BRD06_09215 [Halobacteriales archaeon QS_9_67_15]
MWTYSWSHVFSAVESVSTSRTHMSRSPSWSPRTPQRTLVVGAANAWTTSSRSPTRSWSEAAAIESRTAAGDSASDARFGTTSSNRCPYALRS